MSFAAKIHRVAIGCVIALAGMFAGSAAAADRDAWPGVYTTAPGERTAIKVEIEPQADGYGGTISIGGKQYKFAGNRGESGLILGQFNVDGNPFQVVMVRIGDDLTVRSGKSSYHLTRVGGAPAANAGAPAAAPPAGAPAAGAPPAAGQAPTLALTPQMVNDPYANTDAFSVLVPDGWKMQSHVNWDLTHLNNCAIDIEVVDPHSAAAVIFYPDSSYYDGVRESFVKQMAPQLGVRAAEQRAQFMFPEGKRYGNGMTAEIRREPSTRDFLTNVTLPGFRKDIAEAKDLKIISETDLPKFAQAKVAESANVPGISCTASAIRISYTSADGPMEEQFICVIFRGPPPVPGDPFHFWNAEVQSMRAPMGKLDAMLPLLSTIQSSREKQPQWFAFATAVNQQVLKNQVALTNQIGQNMDTTLQQMRDHARRESEQRGEDIKRKFAAQQHAKSEAAQNFLDYVKDEQQFNIPGGQGRVTLPAGYKYNYISNNGRIISTNDPTYAPPVDPKTSWQQLQPH